MFVLNYRHLGAFDLGFVHRFLQKQDSVKSRVLYFENDITSMSSKRKRAVADALENAPAITSLEKGTRLRVWWTGENQWFSGEVCKCATKKSNDITLHYDDGEILVHDLSTERWQLLDTGSGPIKQRKKNAPEQKRKARDKPARRKTNVVVDQDSDPFIQVRNAFHPSSMDKMTSCRDAQVRAINSFFEGCVSAHAGGSLYLCGSPGTGKTASMGAIQKSLVVLFVHNSVRSICDLQCSYHV